MDAIEKGEQEVQRGISTAISGSGKTVKVTARVSTAVVRKSASAVVALLGAVRRAVGGKHDPEGQVRLREFARAADGKRELVKISDSEVARQLTRELRRYGVLFSVERHPNGDRTFHVQGKDLSLIKHALEVASETVDQRLAQKRSERDAEDVDEVRQLELDEQQRSALREELHSYAEQHQSTDAAELHQELGRGEALPLTEANVNTLGTVFDAKGWATGSAETMPAELTTVLGAVEEERAALGVAPDGTTQQISADRAQVATPTVAAEGRTITHTPTQKPALDARNATRRKVAQTIERKVAEKSAQQNSSAPARRTTKRRNDVPERRTR